MNAPKRIQLRRTKGWRKPEGAIVVARPSRWGNIYVVGTGAVAWSGYSTGECAGHYDTDDVRTVDQAVIHGGLTAAEAVILYEDDLRAVLADEDPHFDDIRDGLASLRGHDLACWCPLHQPCHADVLLELANAPLAPEAR